MLGPVNESGNVSGVDGCYGDSQQVMYLFVMVTLDDSGTAVFPDSAGTLASLTELTVNYHPKHPRRTSACVWVKPCSMAC